jgi:hypothetical protein
VSLSLNLSFFKHILNCWLVDLMLLRSGSTTPCFPSPRTIRPNCLTLCSSRLLIFPVRSVHQRKNISDGSSLFSMGSKRGSS